MYMLVNSPGGGQSKEAFDALDEVFGTNEFSKGQAVNTISVAMELDNATADSLFNQMVRSENIGEV